jgi:hypothetical protein
MILFSSSRHKIEKADKYIEEISQAENLPVEEIRKNRENNKDLLVDHLWTTEQLFMFYKRKINALPTFTRSGFSLDREMKRSKLYNEYYKEYTFRPQITKKAHEVEEK